MLTRLLPMQVSESEEPWLPGAESYVAQGHMESKAEKYEPGLVAKFGLT